MGPLETEEFEPTDFPPEYVAAGLAETIQSILLKVEEALQHTPNVVLIVPRGAQAFHTTHDFLALGRLQWTREVRVSIASLDPTITGLGRVLGFYVVDPPADHPAILGDPSLGSSTLEDVEKPTAPLTISPTGDLPDWVLSPATPNFPTGSLTTSTWLNQSVETGMRNDELTRQSALRAPHSKSGVPAPRTRPRQTGQLLPTQIIDHPISGVLNEASLLDPSVLSATPSGRIKARRVLLSGQPYQNGRGWRYGGFARRAHWGRVLAVVAVLLLVSLAAGSTYAYVYLPEGTVAVTPLNKAVTGLTVGITVVTSPSDDTGNSSTSSGPPDALSAPSLKGTLIQAPLSEEGTHSATGTRQVLRGKGQGIMRFTNRTGSAVFVGTGTKFKAANGVVVQTTQGGTVPATVFGASFGTLDLPVAATVEGPDGNIGTNQISGVYNGVLNYTNVAALQGGSVDTIKVVTQADIDGLAADLHSKAESEMGGAVLDMVASGQQLITQTISLANVAFDADHKAGEDGESVRVKLTAQAQAYVYDENTMHDSIAQAVLDWVSSNIPRTVGPNLDMSSVQYDALVVQSVGDGRVAYTTSADARVTFSLTPDLVAHIRDLVKGKDVRQARTLISETYGSYVNPSSVQASVLWFNIDKLPNDPARIEVQASTGQGGYSPGIGPSQPSAPDPRSRQP
jgi:hypothetical protein